VVAVNRGGCKYMSTVGPACASGKDGKGSNTCLVSSLFSILVSLVYFIFGLIHNLLPYIYFSS
jgi:hypothetical protein